MADNLDMENRDPNGMNSYIQVTFGDVLAEPEGARSADCVWRNSYKCFEGGLSCCYKLLTYICGLPAGNFYTYKKKFKFYSIFYYSSSFMGLLFRMCGISKYLVHDSTN